VKGVFKISVDGEIVFDKASAGHLPTASEVAETVRPRLGERLRWRKTAPD
jgi:predicted Rdx family selenoprotein